VNVLAGFGAVLAVSGSLGEASLFSISVARASSTNEDNLGTLLGFAAVSGSLGQAPLSSIYVTRASSTNEDNLGTLLGFAAVSGSWFVVHTFHIRLFMTRTVKSSAVKYGAQIEMPADRDG
jgi:uncharacterized membrane protein